MSEHDIVQYLAVTWQKSGSGAYLSTTPVWFPRPRGCSEICPPYSPIGAAKTRLVMTTTAPTITADSMPTSDQ